ncbi:hypothetical protein BH23BAC1_BH23BAC1_34960 [soil metagenome]
MLKPIIYFIDEDPDDLQSLEAHLEPFKEKFELRGYNNPEKLINEIKNNPDLPVALFLVDNNLKTYKSSDFIQEVSTFFPLSKKVLMTSINQNDETVKGFKEHHLDCYIIKPFTPAEEKLWPVLNDLLEQWEGVNTIKERQEHINIIGPRWSPKLHKLKDFLSRNLYPYQYFDIENDPEALEKLKEINLEEKNNHAVVIFPDKTYKIQQLRLKKTF